MVNIEQKSRTYDGPNGLLFISILFHNFEFWIPNSEIRTTNFGILNSELWSKCNVGKW